MIGVLKLAAGALAVRQGAKALGLLDMQQAIRTCPRVPRTTHKSREGVVFHKSDVKNIDERICPAIEHIRKSKRDPDFQKKVGKLLSKKCGKKWCITERDSKAELTALYDVAKSNIRFQKDPRGLDTFKSPKRTMEWGFGDCGNGNVALAAMYETAGYETRLRVVAVKPDAPNEYSHVLGRVKNPDTEEWVEFDISTSGKLGDYPAERVSGHRDYEIPA